MVKVFISILNFNGRENTLQCLKSLDEVRIANFELNIVVVDNASKEDFSLDNNFKSRIPVRLIKNSTNLGFSGGNNVGIKYALDNKADYILLLNNDTLVDKLFIENLLKIIESDDKIGAVVPKIYFAKGYEFHKDRYTKEELGKVIWYAGGKMDWNNVIGSHIGVDMVDKGQYDEITDTQIATGCCLLIKKAVLEKIGNFDDKYFLYYEDADLSMRIKKNNYRIVYVPSSVIWHKNAGASGGSGSALQDYYISRNRLLFGFKYAPLRSKFSLFKESLTILRSGRKWQKRGIKDYYSGKFGKGSFNE